MSKSKDDSYVKHKNKNGRSDERSDEPRIDISNLKPETQKYIKKYRNFFETYRNEGYNPKYIKELWRKEGKNTN